MWRNWNRRLKDVDAGHKEVILEGSKDKDIDMLKSSDVQSCTVNGQEPKEIYT